MSQEIYQQVHALLSTQTDPYLNQPLADYLGGVSEKDGHIQVELALPYPCAGRLDALKAELADAGLDADLVVTFNIAENAGSGRLPGMAGVKNIVAVASGKGGVGKSTTTVNLALAMAAEGARVGILDADIYGPSQGTMLGVPEGQRPESHDEKYFQPIEALGLQSMSMAYLVDENTPMVWRGPMVSGAMQQLLTQTKWDELDYLFIDMPPGTGDIQLTLSQKVPVSGAVVVTTPQDIALLDAQKGIEMFRKVDIPVLGVVENMSTHICSNCGHEEHIFGAGGGERIAKEYETEQLGALPLSLSIREQADSGKPTVVAEPDSEAANSYREIARKLAAKLAKQVQDNSAQQAPSFSVVDD